MNGLEKCPFCGGEMNGIELVSWKDQARIYHKEFMEARDKCLSRSFVIEGVKTIKQARDKWNKRKGA